MAGVPQTPTLSPCDGCGVESVDRDLRRLGESVVICDACREDAGRFPAESADSYVSRGAGRA